MPTHSKYIWSVVALCMCLVVILVVLMYTRQYVDREGTNLAEGSISDSESEVQTIFREQLTQRAVERVGQPIEGFDAALLMDAYPGLLPIDFNAVSAHGGLYVYDDDELVFVRDTDMPTTSAERTLTKEAYAILLENLTARTGVATTNAQEVLELIDSIAVVEEIRAMIGKGVTIAGVTLIPQEVVEDSRCPAHVNCIWAGIVRVRTILEGAGGTSEYVLTLGEPVQTEYASITLSRVEPEASLDGPIEPKSYRFYFQVDSK